MFFLRKAFEIKAGQVFHLYKGQADNGTLLLNYGFCLAQNPHDGGAGLLVRWMTLLSNP